MFACSQAVTQGPIATATTTDKSDAEFIRAGCKKAVRAHTHSSQRYRRRSLDEVSARNKSLRETSPAFSFAFFFINTSFRLKLI
jgi:hypothetical protein